MAGMYDLEHTIGQGHFAVVKLAKHVFTGEKVSVLSTVDSLSKHCIENFDGHTMVAIF